MKKVILFFLAIIFISCSKEESSDCVGPASDCVKQFREAMSITSDQSYPNGCQVTFGLWEGDGGFYFLGCAHCADCESIPLACNGEFLHATIASQEEYFAYINNSEYVRVIGYIE